jgi:hypothetical protein
MVPFGTPRLLHSPLAAMTCLLVLVAALINATCLWAQCYVPEETGCDCIGSFPPYWHEFANVGRNCFDVLREDAESDCTFGGGQW